MCILYVFLLLSLSQISTAIQGNNVEEPQSLTETICANRNSRSEQCEVELDVPQACATDNTNGEDPACPIVLFLHGSGGTNDWFARTSGVHEVNYIGVYPQGEKGWNTGPKSSNICRWDDFECTDDPDEGDFIASILTEIRSQGGSGNVYAIGNSNGAALAHRLAANAGALLPIKGIVAKVTQLLSSPERYGPGGLNYNQPGRGSSPVSILSVMGTDDGLIPYEGGTSSVFRGNDAFQLMPALASMTTWAIHNGCDASAIESSLSTDIGTEEATFYNYSVGCPSGVILEHYALHGSGHNAGRASIEGTKINYGIAYDFIARVEDASDEGSPVSSPVTSPVASPVAQPTGDSCVDDSAWSGKFNEAHTCEYVSQNPTNRCGWEDSDGIRASEACVASCDENCSSSPVASPVTLAPVASPVAQPTGDSCVDDSSWSGKFNKDHTCEYVSQNPTNRCGWEDSDGIRAFEACAASCDEVCQPLIRKRNLRYR